MRTQGTQGNSRARLLGLSSVNFSKLDEVSSCIAALTTLRKANLQENWKRGITASSHIFIFNYGAFAAEKKAYEIVNCCLKETKHDDERLAGKSPKNLDEFESNTCMEKINNEAVFSMTAAMTAALLLIFPLLK